MNDWLIGHWQKRIIVKDIQYSGPIYKFHRVKGNVVEIDFEHGEEGLNTGKSKRERFEIVGTDGIFRPAKAEIISGSSTVKVWMIRSMPP